MSSKPPVCSPVQVAKRPPIAAVAAAVFAVALVAAIAWTTCTVLHSQTPPPPLPPPSDLYLNAVAVAVNDTVTDTATSAFDLQSDETQKLSMVPQLIRKKSSFDDVQDNSRYERDYVKPIKSIPESLHAHDILYGGDQIQLDQGKLIKHHSGHYRHKTAFIWDPHPQYKFTAFGHSFHLMLAHDSKFVSPGIKIIHLKQNMSWREPPNVKVDGCFYSGNVFGEPSSVVTVSLCGGITGHIHTTTGNYFIEPAETTDDHLTPALHTIYRTRPRTGGNDSAEQIQQPRQPELNCELQDNEVTSNLDTVTDEYDTTTVKSFVSVTNENSSIKNVTFVSTSSIPYTPKSRKKRSLSSENIIELMIVADKKMADYHGERLHNYIFTLMSIVSKIYKDKSIGNPMHIAVVKLIILRDIHFVESRNRMNDISATELLHKFCEWQVYHNDPNEASENHYDSAILLTRGHICPNHNKKCENALGLAQLGTMCKVNSCAIVQDNGLNAAFTIAHEIGHVLSMPHDDDARCKDFEQKDGAYYVMSTMLGHEHNSQPWTWSNCSRHYLTEFLETGNGKCLQDDPSKDYLEIEKKNIEKHLPGEIYSEDKQCELINGSGSKICSYMPVCQNLWCTPGSGEKYGCFTRHMPWAEGTPCKNNESWCQKGKCVPKDRNALKPVNGGWGPWQPFGECTRTCGGGVKKSYRDCNDPPPSNGGKYCVGKRIRVRSCATNDCPPGTPDFRGQQCAMFNNNTFNITDLRPDVQWIPKFGIYEKERCKLICRVASSTAYYQLKDRVVDGTPCAPDGYDICVNGACERAGCDHVLDSDSRLDTCGVCGGDNSSCVKVSGAYNSTQPQSGYTKVLRIPAGSSNLDIRQRGYNGSSKDDNYLALVDSVTGKYILNGDNVLIKFNKVVVYGGTAIEYSGSDAPVERINSSRPLNKDITVELLSTGNLYAPDIVYQYTVMRKEREVYVWESTDKWGECDSICSGEQRRIYSCIVKETGEEAPGRCSEQDEPQQQKRPCNLHCSIKWKVLSQSECSVQCGSGTSTQNVACVQEYEKRAPSQLPDTMCSHLAKPSNSVPCNGQCLESRWMFTEWTPCSKTCGSGIQYREAHCVNDNGEPKEETSCNYGDKIISRACATEKCPEWSVGEWSSCSVTCGDGQMERSVWCRTDNGTVLDPEYCDSNKPATNQSCSLNPCPAWTIGLWSQCSVTCGIGIVRRFVRCNVPDESACALIAKPLEEERCILHPCADDERHENEIHAGAHINSIQSNKIYVWRTDHWSSCSASCGNGYRRRRIDCINTMTGEPAPWIHCKAKNQPKRQETCIAPMCVTWRTDEWKECSAECGEGFEERDVTCVSSVSGKLVDETHCVVHSEKPESQRSCESRKSCKPVATWRTGPWGECSEACGGGVKERKVVCQPFGGPKRDVSEEEMCAEPKPLSSTPCNEQPCNSQPTYVTISWNFGEWSKCNVTCGKGYQHRQVQCQDSAGAPLAASQCYGLAEPAAMQPCRASAPCPRPATGSTATYRWKTSLWSACSVTCGPGGTLSRHISCLRRSDRGGPSSSPWDVVADNGLCEVAVGPAPAARKPCARGRRQWRPCPAGTSVERGETSGAEYGWSADAWRECSHACGKKGRQTRRVYCHRKSTGERAHHRHCDPSARPHKKRKCNQRRCAGHVSCAGVLQKQPAATDREYVLNVHGRNVSVYCHGMRSGGPVEYLTLARDNENYSEIYEQRLSDPSSCPFNGERRQNCPCDNVPVPSSGLTVFHKIRFNVTTMRVNSKDFTFSKQIRGKPVPFGEAGDCYSHSKSGCPQGRFSIDLTGTGMRVSKDTTWVGKGSNTSFWVNKIEENTKIVGRCGGYCGTCVPSQGLILDVV